MKRRLLANRNTYTTTTTTFISAGDKQNGIQPRDDDFEEYRFGRMVGLFITGGGPNSSYDTLFINGFRGTRRFTTLNNVDSMAGNGERAGANVWGGRAWTAAAVVVANTVQKPPRIFAAVRSFPTPRSRACRSGGNFCS